MRWAIGDDWIAFLRERHGESDGTHEPDELHLVGEELGLTRRM
jgi:hypothetical protein